MLRTNDSKSGTRSYTLGNFRTLLLICQCFSFEAFRTVKFIQQIAANLNCGYLGLPCTYSYSFITEIEDALMPRVIQ